MENIQTVGTTLPEPTWKSPDTETITRDESGNEGPGGQTLVKRTSLDYAILVAFVFLILFTMILIMTQ